MFRGLLLFLAFNAIQLSGAGINGAPWARLPDPPADPKQLLNKTVLWDYGPLLEPLGLARGLHSKGDQSRMRRFVSRLMTGKSVNIVAMGTSITYGVGSSRTTQDTSWPSYPEQLQAWLRAAFPASNATVINAGMAYMTTAFFEACSQALLPQDGVHLVIFEMLARYSTALDNPWNTAYERLVRYLLQLPAGPAVVAMHTYSYIDSSRDFWDSPENEMNIYSAYYGVPILSMRSAVFPFIVEGRKGYRADKTRLQSIADGLGEPATDFLYWEDSELYGPTGHRYLAEMVIGLVQQTAAALETPGDSQPLPPPMIPNNYERAQPLCGMRDQLKGALRSSKAFQWRCPDEAPKSCVWAATRDGASAMFQLDLRVANQDRNASLTAAGATKLVVGYFSTNSDMTLECLSGCRCADTLLDPLGFWTTQDIEVDGGRACQIRISVALGEGWDYGGSRGAVDAQVGMLVVVPSQAFDFGMYPGI